MAVECARPADFEAWIALAREVEPLFGPMADQEGFREALRQAIADRIAFRAAPTDGQPEHTLPGGIIVSKECNHIAWLAVARAHRGKGLGRELLAFALAQLERQQDILVQTFAASVPEGRVARRLYEDFGFVEQEPAGLNPAGAPTTMMRLPARAR